jgi:hypothetical protein
MSSLVQQQKSDLSVKFVFLFLNVAYFNCHGDIAIIISEILLVNIV